jgi:hypothetical protein
MDITAAHVREALAVKRGEKRLAAVADDARAAVGHVLRTASDAYLATVAGAAERRASRIRPTDTAFFAKTRRARST